MNNFDCLKLPILVLLYQSIKLEDMCQYKISDINNLEELCAKRVGSRYSSIYLPNWKLEIANNRLELNLLNNRLRLINDSINEIQEIL